MTNKKIIDPKPNKIALIAIAVFCITAFFGGYFLINSLAPKNFRIEDDLYAKSEAIDIQKDEYVEITPHSMRLRKIILDETERKRANMREQSLNA